MPVLQLFCARDPRRLLDAAADGFLVRRAATTETPFPVVEYFLALRQGGLRDDLFSRAAQAGIGGWWNPPLCTFAELPEILGLPPKQPIGDFARLVLVGEVARNQTPELLGRLAREGAFLDALDRFIGDLTQEGVSADSFSSALARIPDRDSFERLRDTELTALYRGWLDALAREKLRDPRAARVDCARLIRADPARVTTALGGRRELRLLGMHDLRGGWHQLITALADSGALDRLAIYGADPSLGATLGVQPEILGQPDSLGDRLFDGTPDLARTVEVISAPDPERALEAIAVAVRRLLDNGVPPTRIAVVTRQARPVVDLAVDALERAGVPAAARRRIGFAEIPAVRALAALFAAAGERWNRHGLAEVASQPYLAMGLDQRLINYLGFERRIEGLNNWVTAFEDLARRAAAGAESEERGRPLPQADRINRALNGMRTFAQLAQPLDAPRPLADWLAWLAGAIAQDRFGIERAIHQMVEGRWDLVRRDLAGWRALRAAVDEWRSAVERWNAGEAPLSALQFHERLQELLSADAALWTPAHRGVRVLEALAAAYRGFDHVFIVGLEAGAFPSPPPRSPLLHESERDALAAVGLPFETHAEWDARERTLFRLLASSAPAPVMVFSRLDDRGREVAVSAFVEAIADVATPLHREIATGAVLTPGFPLWTTDVAAAQARHGAFIERERAMGMPGLWNGQVADPALLARLAERLGESYVWSPTQLESFAKCPWAWFSQRLLKLELLEDPEVDLDKATRGSILHKALQKLFDRLVTERGGPVLLREADLPAVQRLGDQMLAEAIAAAGEVSWLGHRALHQSRLAEMQEILRGYLAWEVEQNEKSFDGRTAVSKQVRTAVAKHELGFDGLVFERNGVRIRLRGSIDRVEVEMDDKVEKANWVAAVDYKSSKWSVPGSGDKKAWAEKVVLQVPLYAWAIEQLWPGSRAARTEYRSLKKPEALLVLKLATVTRKTGAVDLNAEARELMDRSLDAVTEHVQLARGGQFPAKYLETCCCPEWCHGWDICRVPGGPKPLFDW